MVRVFPTVSKSSCHVQRAVEANDQLSSGLGVPALTTRQGIFKSVLAGYCRLYLSW